MKYRWLNDEGQVRYVGKRWPEHKGKVGRVIALPPNSKGGTNVLVQLDDHTVLSTPAGTLRMEVPG